MVAKHLSASFRHVLLFPIRGEWRQLTFINVQKPWHHVVYFFCYSEVQSRSSEIICSHIFVPVSFGRLRRCQLLVPYTPPQATCLIFGFLTVSFGRVVKVASVAGAAQLEGC